MIFALGSSVKWPSVPTRSGRYTERRRWLARSSSSSGDRRSVTSAATFPWKLSFSSSSPGNQRCSKRALSDHTTKCCAFQILTRTMLLLRQVVEERGVELGAPSRGEWQEVVLEIAGAQHRPYTDVGRDFGGTNRVADSPVLQRCLHQRSEHDAQHHDEDERDQAEAREKADATSQLAHAVPPWPTTSLGGSDSR